MGSYVLKINPTARVIAGITVHAASYGYKPWGRSREDDRAYRASGCERAEKAWDKLPRGPVNVVQLGTGGKLYDGSAVHVLANGTCGTIIDDTLAEKPVLGHFHKVKGRWTFVPAAEIAS